MLTAFAHIFHFRDEALAAARERGLEILTELGRPGRLGFRGDFAPRAVVEELESIGIELDELINVVAELSKVGAHLIDAIDAERRVHGALRPRLIRDVDAAREVFGVLLDLFLLVLGHGRKRGLAEWITRCKWAVGVAVGRAPASPRGYAAGVAPRELRLAEDRRRNRAEDVVVVRRRHVEPIDVLRIHFHLHVGGREDHDARRTLGKAIEIVRGPEVAVPERTVVMAVASVHVVRDRARAAAHRPRKRVRVTGFEQVVRDDVPGEGRERLDGRAVELTQASGLCVGAGKAPVRHVAILRETRDALLGHEIKLGRAARSLLREYLNHPGRRLRAVQGGGGGAFQYLDVLDGLRIDVVEARRITAAASADVVPEAAAAIHAHAVHVDDRLVWLRQARGAADANARAFTRQAAGRQDADSRLSCREHFRHVVDRRGLELIRIDRRDGVAELAALGCDARARDDDRIESDRPLRHREIRGHRRVRRNGHRLVTAAVPDVTDAQDDLAERYVELVLPGGVRQRAEIRAEHADLGSVQRALSRRVDDRAFYRAGRLRRGREGAGACQRHAGTQGAQRPRPTKRSFHRHLLRGATS